MSNLKRSTLCSVALSTIGALTSATTADFYAVVSVGYEVTAIDFGGTEVTAYVVDVYMLSDDLFEGTSGSGDTLLNVYHWNTVAGAPDTYFQSFTGSGWQPTNLGGPFNTDALQRADSFVTIGGFGYDALQIPGAGSGVGLDPPFGGNNAAAPGAGAGWYNGNPPSYIGGATETPVGIGSLIGRFTSQNGPFSLAGTTLEATWNRGLGTPGQQASFTITDFDDGDCNENGTDDTFDIAQGLSTDCNLNGIPDECELADGTSSDYDEDGLLDDCEGGIVGVDFATIAEGISATPDDGVLVVPAGNFSTPISLDRPILIVASDGPEATVLTNAGAPRTIVSAHGAPSGAVLRGFTITNGVGVSGLVGGGVDAIDSHLRLEGCVLRSNFGTDGGGARFFGGAPTIVDCVFESNLSGGVGGGLRLISADATVSDCEFRANEADDGSGLAIAITDGMSSIQGIDVESHAAQAVRFEDTDGFGTAELVDARIHDNIQQGVLVVSDRPEFLALIDSRVCGNDAPGSPVVGPFSDGGGNILLTDRCPDLVVPDDADTIQMAVDASIDGERIAVRQGDLDHVGFSFNGRDVEVIAVPGPELVRITGPVLAIDGEPATALLRGFEVRDGFGTDSLSGREGIFVGGNLVLDGSSLTLEECRIDSGQAEYGGGAFIRGGGATLLNCEVSANLATAEGGGIYVDGSGPMSVSMSGLNITGNLMPSAPQTRGGGIRIGGDQATVTMGGVTICSNERENLAGTVTESAANSICLAFDCDANGIEDAADIGDLGQVDCNGNFVPDDCDIASGLDADCNANGALDSCDLADGAPDLDLDGVLDACQSQLVFSVPERFGSIGEAVLAATEGSRIQLAAGNYNEAVDLGSMNIELVGDSADPASVEIDAFGLGSTVLTIAGGQDASTRIIGVTIKQGIADMPEPGSPANLVGGGLFIDGAAPIIEDCIITTNDAARGGGGYLRDSAAIFRRTIIEGNTAAAGAGLWWSGGIVSLEDCTVRENISQGNGGGMRLATDGGSILGGSITGNLAADDGAGVWWQGSISPLGFDGVTISGNIAGSEGGGVLAKFAAPGVTFANSTVCDNEPDEIAGPYQSLGGNDLCVCPWDLSGNGVVGAEDVGILLSQWGQCPDGCSGDFDGDGQASASDLGPLLGAWGVCP